MNYFRLFYLCQNTWLRNITEEKFFKCLTWCYTSLSGIIVSVFLGENFFNLNETQTSFIWYSSCSKVPIMWQNFTGSIFNNVFAISHIVVLSIGAFSQIALLKRQRELEEQKANGIMAVIYKNDGVTITRRALDYQSCKILQRHNRSVVTPWASLTSFLVNLLIIILLGKFFFYMGPSGPPLLEQFFVFSTLCIHFFLFSFVETICSPSLRNSLIRCLPRKEQYHVVYV